MSSITIELEDLSVEVEYDIHTDVLEPENKKVTEITIIHTNPEYIQDRYCEDILEEKVREVLSDN